jgi:mannose-1-phosphate guanylyltransferase
MIDQGPAHSKEGHKVSQIHTLPGKDIALCFIPSGDYVSNILNTGMFILSVSVFLTNVR